MTRSFVNSVSFLSAYYASNMPHRASRFWRCRPSPRGWARCYRNIGDTMLHHQSTLTAWICLSGVLRLCVGSIGLGVKWAHEKGLGERYHVYSLLPAICPTAFLLFRSMSSINSCLLIRPSRFTVHQPLLGIAIGRESQRADLLIEFFQVSGDPGFDEHRC